MPERRDPDIIEIIASTAIGTGIALDASGLADLDWPYYATAATVIVINWAMAPFFEEIADKLRTWRPGHQKGPDGRAGR